MYRFAKHRTHLLLLLAVVMVIAVFFAPPVAQDPDYHDFADQRTLIGIAHFWNVLSNLPFVLFGAAGMFVVARLPAENLARGLRGAYYIFFIGVLLTGVGSSWYHLAPDNQTLFWDRLPMTIAFMALFSIVIGEFVCPVSAKRVLVPLLIAGAASVLYWDFTEASGVGDLRPYALVQFLPIIVMPIILLAYRSEASTAATFWVMIALYVASKVFEQADLALYEQTAISGHSVKHLFASAAAGYFAWALARRPSQAASVST